MPDFANMTGFEFLLRVLPPMIAIAVIGHEVNKHAGELWKAVKIVNLHRNPKRHPTVIAWFTSSRCGICNTRHIAVLKSLSPGSPQTEKFLVCVKCGRMVDKDLVE